MKLSMWIGQRNTMVSLSIVVVLLTICTAALQSVQSVPRINTELASLPFGNHSNQSATSDSTMSLAAATKSLNISGRARNPNTELSIAASALLMVLILGVDKTLWQPYQESLQEPQSTLRDSKAALPTESRQLPSSHQVHATRYPRNLHPRQKRSFPNASSCCPIPHCEPSTPHDAQDRTPSRSGRKHVTFDAVHVREIEWAPVDACCEHGIPDYWECSVGAHYSYSIAAAEQHREQTGRLAKGEYCWTSHRLSGPKLECEHCCTVPSTPPLPPPPSPDKKALVENEAPSLGCPENVVALNSRSKIMTELYFKEKLQWLAA